MNLYFIRHGDPDYKTDSLTETGKNQAKKLADYIALKKVDEIYLSPLGRAQETASYCLKKWNKTGTIESFLKEIEWGDLSGNAYSTSSPWTIREKIIKNEHCYPTGDDWKKHPLVINDRLVQDIEKRELAFDEFLKTLGYERKNQLYESANPNSKEIYIFCHSGIIAALMAHILNIPFWQFITHIDLGMTSVSKIYFNEEKGLFPTKLIKLNDMTHLE